MCATIVSPSTHNSVYHEFSFRSSRGGFHPSVLVDSDTTEKRVGRLKCDTRGTAVPQRVDIIDYLCLLPELSDGTRDTFYL